MKYEAEKLEVEKFIFKKELLKPGIFNSINEKQDFTPFPYANPSNKNLFKIVFGWHLILKTSDLKNTILELEAEQEFRILFDGNNDKEVLKNIVNTSHLHLQEEITIRIKNSAMRDYRLPGINDDAAADNIFSSLGR